MEEGKIMLMFQLVNNLEENFYNFNNAYNQQDKEKFDKFKKAVLEAQRRIDYLLKQN